MKKIFVIDDSEVSLFLIKAIFEDEPDINIAIESNSRKALSFIREGNPDLLVLDLMMPHIDGIQILQEIRSDSRIGKIPILIISASHDAEIIKKAIELGIQGYIRKPIEMKEVEEKIRNILTTKPENLV